MKRSDARKRDSLMEKSKMWYETAAKQGHVPSKVGFAKMCLEDPTNDNVQQALKIYEEADTAGNVDATYNLGFVIPLDVHDSLDLLRGSVQRGEGPQEGLRLPEEGGGHGRRVGVLLLGLLAPPRAVRE